MTSSPLIITTPWCRYFHPIFSKETKNQECEVIGQVHATSKWESWDVNPRCSTVCFLFTVTTTAIPNVASSYSNGSSVQPQPCAGHRHPDILPGDLQVLSFSIWSHPHLTLHQTQLRPIPLSLRQVPSSPAQCLGLDILITD